MTRRHSWSWLLALLALVLGLAFTAAGCGGGGDEEAADDGGTATTPAEGGSEERTFAHFRIAFDDGLDYLDPGLSYTVQGWSIMWNVYLPLLTYKHTNGPEGATLIPALAEELPEVSEDGLTYSLTLREGVTYSDGSPVKASDVKASIQRLYQIDSPGVGFFSGIKGAEEYSELKKPAMRTGDIPGIVTDDQARTIQITLTKPQGDFLNVLATQFAGVIPAKTAAQDQSASPPPATGPYMIQSYQPNKSVVLVRNPEYEPLSDDLPRGNPDRLTFSIIEEDARALQTVIDGQNDYNFHTIPVDRLGEVQEQYADRLKLYTPANTYYFFMNTRVAPFDDINVRKAVNHAIDREALVRLFGGLATTTENVLPPTYPQYDKIEMYPHDVAKAKQLVQQAGHNGTAVTVWASSRETSRKPAEYLNDVLNEIGLKAKLKVIDPEIYFTTIGNQQTKAQTGVANWFQDYPHPLNWFDVLLNGNRITETHNNNYSNANVAEINRRIEQLKREPELTDDVNEQWAEIDRLVAENALWAPYVNRQFTDFFSEDMDIESCYVNHVLYQLDYIQVCKKS